MGAESIVKWQLRSAHSEFRIERQPFTEPIVMPRMKNFWKKG